MTFPDKQTVLDFLDRHPHITSRREIAKGLSVKGKERTQLREVLKDLEREGNLERTGKRAYARADAPPSTTVVVFMRIDEHGDLIGKALGRDGPFGPDLIYAGAAHRSRGKGQRQKEPGIGDRGLCRLSESSGGWKARLIKLFDKREDEPVIGLFTRHGKGGRIESADRRQKRELLVEASDVHGADDGDLVRAEPKPMRGHPSGPRHYVVREVIGKAGDPRAASLIAIHAHSIPTEFPDAALEEARAANAAPSEREDLTQTPLITIDPDRKSVV